MSHAAGGRDAAGHSGAYRPSRPRKTPELHRGTGALLSSQTRSLIASSPGLSPTARAARKAPLPGYLSLTATTNFQKARSLTRHRTSVATNNRSRPYGSLPPDMDCTIKANGVGRTVGSPRTFPLTGGGRRGLRTRIRDRRVSMRKVA